MRVILLAFVFITCVAHAQDFPGGEPSSVKGGFFDFEQEKVDVTKMKQKRKKGIYRLKVKCSVVVASGVTTGEHVDIMLVPNEGKARTQLVARNAKLQKIDSDGCLSGSAEFATAYLAELTEAQYATIKAVKSNVANIGEFRLIPR